MFEIISDGQTVNAFLNGKKVGNIQKIELLPFEAGVSEVPKAVITILNPRLKIRVMGENITLNEGELEKTKKREGIEKAEKVKAEEEAKEVERKVAEQTEDDLLDKVQKTEPSAGLFGKKKKKKR